MTGSPSPTPPNDLQHSGIHHRLQTRLLARLNHAIDDFRHRLAYIDALPQLTLLGLICGVLAGLVIVALRLAIDLPLSQLLPAGADDFESLSWHWHLLLPTLGGLGIGALLALLDKRHQGLGVGHVLHRLHHHQGQLPLVNIAVQFVGAALSLLTGQSVGREGPAVHLGAGAASQLGQWLKLPNNSLRTLVGCGVAAAIAASFNTPMAGVIFAMEVVLMEYTIIGFLPVILASVSGAVVTRLVFGNDSVLPVADIQLQSLQELPYVVLAGLVIALCASTYIRLVLAFQRLRHHSIILRLGGAGLLTGLIACAVPQVLGLGYDTIAATLTGHLGIAVLLLIIAGKVLSSAASVGLGMPGGLIAPCLVIGACIGGLLGVAVDSVMVEDSARLGFYVLLGMTAMMGAVLNAPLAALMAVLELTYNSNLIFPSMLIIVVSCLATRQLSNSDGFFMDSLNAAGTPINAGPAQQILSRVGVRSVMNTSFVTCPPMLPHDRAHQLLSDQPLWVVIEELGVQRLLLRAADLANFLEHPSDAILALEEEIDLTRIPGQRFTLLPIHQRANLYEAQQLLQQKTAEAVYVERAASPLHSPVRGIITLDAINTHYQL